MKQLLRKYNSSIKYRLLVPVMSALLLVFYLMYMQINDATRAKSIEQTKELSLSEARRIASETNAFFNEAKNTTSVLAQSFLAQRNYSSKSRQLILNTLHQVLSEKKGFYALFTMWEENAFDNLDLEYGKKYDQKIGRFSASAYWEGDSIVYQNHNILVSDIPAYLSDGGSEEFADEYYMLPKTSKNLLITEPYLYSYTKSDDDVVNMSSVVHPIMDGNEFLGIVGIDIDITILRDVIRKKDVSSEMDYSIISAEGAIIANDDAALIGERMDSLTILSFKEIQDSLKKVDYLVSEHFSNYQKREIIQYFLSIDMEGVQAPWLVMVEIPTKEIYADSRRLSLMITLVSSLGLLLLMVIIYYHSHSIIKPIEAIVVFAQKLASGHLHSRIETTRNDELGKLIESLHFMAKELCKHTHELESLVKEKTEEIETVNEELTATNEELYDKNDELESALENIKAAQSQLLVSEKMASLGTLTAGVAHEINNPLNYIMGAYIGLSDALNEDHVATDKNTEILLESIRTGIDKISDIVQGLSQFSRTNNNVDEECEIHSIIDNCLVMLHNKIKHNVTVRREYCQDKLIINGNVGKLHQVFLNVIDNAVYASEQDGEISILTAAEDDIIKIEIVDTGSGIHEENLKQIIEPFYTTKPPGEGTGLGLSITYSIIKEHNGTLEYESDINQGTKAIIKFIVKKQRK
jgi:signal transduction histidine kinase